MGEREKEREREGRECVEKCCFSLQNDRKEPQKCKKCIYIASQKAWFTAFIAILKKIEHTLQEEIILNEVRIGGSPPINGTPQVLSYYRQQSESYILRFVSYQYLGDLPCVEALTDSAHNTAY